MALKKFKPVTNSTRFKSVNDFKGLSEDAKPHKKLLEPKPSSGGRNSQGRLAVWHKGGGHKQKYRVVDFRRDKLGVPGKIKTLEYDPNRNVFIGLTSYADGEYRYTLMPEGLKVGDSVLSGAEAEIRTGNCLPLEKIPVGTAVHNIELSPGRGGQIARSAGTSAILSSKLGDYAILKLPSSETRKVLLRCMATIGVLGNQQANRVSLGKAGRSRWLGIRPTVRGVAMNPVDHPMGGGEGRTSGGRHPVSRTGVPTKGYKTRKKRKTTSKYIISRRKK